MAEMTSAGRPSPAVIVSGVETPRGRSVALALARAGHRVCLLLRSERALEPSALPGHERLRHVAVSLEPASAEPGAPGVLSRAARRAEEQLGHVTALVHVTSLEPPADAEEQRDFAGFSAELAAAAGGFLALGLALLPGMFATQTGCLCLLLDEPRGGPQAPLGSRTLQGALVGAALELSERVEETPLRCIALYAEPGELTAASQSALVRQVGPDSGADQIGNGWFSSLSGPRRAGPIELLRPPAAAPQVASAAVAAAPAPARAPGRDRVAVQLAQTFRAAFGLPPDADVSNLGVSNVKRWDSLGHLKLMMEVEQALRVRLPAESLSRIQSYKDLERAVRAHLPAS